jgi:hypothetical protein
MKKELEKRARSSVPEEGKKGNTSKPQSGKM